MDTACHAVGFWPAITTTECLYIGDDSSIPPFSPRPDYFYDYYMKRFLGDHMVTSVSNSGSVVVYAYVFNSGEISLIVINKGNTDETVWVFPGTYGCGSKYYVYSLQGEVLGSEDINFPSGVSVNDHQPEGAYWGPANGLQDVKANGYDIGSEIKFSSPGRSVQYVMIEPGSNLLSGYPAKSTRNEAVPKSKPGAFYPCCAGISRNVEVLNQDGRIVFEWRYGRVSNCWRLI